MKSLDKQTTMPLMESVLNASFSKFAYIVIWNWRGSLAPFYLKFSVSDASPKGEGSTLKISRAPAAKSN